MPTTKFTFTVEGGQTVTGTFEKVAQAAETAQARVARASSTSGAGMKALDAAAKDLRGTIDELVGSLGPLGSALESFSTTGGVMGLAIAGITAFGVAMVEATRRAAEHVAELGHSAERLGIHAQALQAWQIVGAEAGVSTEKLQTSLQMLAKNLGLAEANTGPLYNILRKINPELLAQLKATHDVGDALTVLNRALSEETDATKRAAEAAAAFGRGYAEAMPLLRQSTEEIEKQKEHLQEMGAIVGTDTIANAEALHKKWVEVGAVISGNVQTALLAHTDTLVKILDLVEKITAQWGKVAAGPAPPARIEEIKATLERGTIGGPGGRPLTGSEIDALRAEQARLEQTILDQTAKDIAEYNDKFRKAGGIKAGEAESFIKNLTASGRQGAFTKEQAAGIYGNVIAESGGVPTAVGPGGSYGLMQWQGDRLKGLQTFARWRGVNVNDLNTQMDYIDLERTGQDARFRPSGGTEKGAYELANRQALGLVPTTPLPAGVQPGSAEAFAFAYGKTVERPLDLSQSLARRMKAATFAETQVSGVDDTRAWEKQQHALDEASKAAEAHQKKLDALGEKSKEVADAIAVFRNEEQQLAEGVLPKDVDETAKLQAAGEKLTAALVKQAKEAGGDVAAAKALGEAFTAESIKHAQLKQSIEQTIEAEKQHATAMRELETITNRVTKQQEDLAQAVALAQRPLDKTGSAIAEVQKKWEDLGQAITAEIKLWQEWIDKHKNTEDVSDQQARLDAWKAEAAAEIQVGEAADEARVHQLEWADALKSAFSAADSIITDAFEGWILGTQKADQAFKSMGASILKSVTEVAAGIAKSLVLEAITGQPQQNTALDLFRGLFGGGTGVAAGATAVLPGPYVSGAVATARGLPAGATASGLTGDLGARGVSTGLTGLLGEVAPTVAAIASILATLGFTIKGALDQASSVKAATLGTSQSSANAIKALGIGGAVAGVAGGAVAGAAVGSVFPGIGTAIGAAVGAAVGGALSSAVTSAVSGAVIKGTKDAVAKGLNQEQLTAKVQEGVKSNILLNILAPGVIQLDPKGSPLARLFTPDIERIFGKMFREILGSGTGGVGGGFSTANVPVGSTSAFGLQRQRPEAIEAARLIAESFGAGGEAFGPDRAAVMSSIILGAARARIKKTGEDASVVIAEEFASAFGGNLMAALRVAMGLEKGRHEKDFAFIGQEFTKGTNQFGFNFATVTQAVQAEGIVPGGKAVKASQKAFGDAFTAALQNASDSSAFRKSMEKSIEDAFTAGAGKALTSGPLGQAFATLFSVSNKAPTFRRRKLRRARRRGDTGAQIEILSAEFQDDVATFAKLIADPAFTNAIKTFTDQLLRMQVVSAAAAGDIQGAADAITAQLAPAIKQVTDIIQLQRDIRSRTAIALAGPGFAGEYAGQVALTQQRQDVEQAFRAQFGGAGLKEFATAVQLLAKRPEVGAEARFALTHGGFVNAQVQATAAISGPDQQRLFQQLQAFADARLKELEGELALLHSLHDTLEQAADSFRGLKEQAQQALGVFDSGKAARDLVTKAAVTGYRAAAAGAFSGDPSKAAPDQLAKFLTALSTAVSAVAARLQFLQSASQSAQSLIESVTTARGGRTGANEILAQRLAELPAQLATAVGGGPGADEATTKSLQLLSDAINGTTQRLQFFKAAIDSFTALAESAATAIGGLDAQSVIFKKRIADISANLPTALGAGAGAEDAFDKIQKALGEAIQIASQQLAFFTQAGDAFESFANQADIAARGRRGAREQLGDTKALIQQLLPAAIAGSADAITQLQKLLPQAFSLGQQALTGGRARGLDTYLQHIAKILEDASKAQAAAAKADLEKLGGIATKLSQSAAAQATDADKQLKQLQDNAQTLKDSTDAGTADAKAQLATLEKLAGVSEFAAGAGLSTTDTLLLTATTELTQFVADMQPVLDYLSNTAQATLHGDFDHIAKLLGDDPAAPILLALQEVKAALPGGRAAGGVVYGGGTYLVGERGPEWATFDRTVSTGQIMPVGTPAPITQPPVTYVVNGPLVVYQNPPRSQAEADLHGRTTADALERRLLAFLARQPGARRVA